MYRAGPGYSPAYADGSDSGYPDANGGVWLEGTFSVAYAKRQNWADPKSDAYMTFITPLGIPRFRTAQADSLS
jgi:hypothetical protein